MSHVAKNLSIRCQLRWRFPGWDRNCCSCSSHCIRKLMKAVSVSEAVIAKGCEVRWMMNFGPSISPGNLLAQILVNVMKSEDQDWIWAVRSYEGGGEGAAMADIYFYQVQLLKVMKTSPLVLLDMHLMHYDPIPFFACNQWNKLDYNCEKVSLLIN